MGLTLLSQPAQAALITFNLDGWYSGLNTVTETVGGVTLTASNFSNGISSADSDGLCFASTSDQYCPSLDSLNLFFSEPVQLISYQTGWFTLDSATLTFSQNDSSSVQASFVDESTTNFTNQFNVVANQAISVTATGLTPSEGSSLFIRQLTVDQVPEPLTLLGATAAVGFGAAFKRRSGKAQQK